MKNKTKIFLLNILVWFGMAFLGGLVVDSWFIGQQFCYSECIHNIIRSLVISLIAALVQIKAYLQNEEKAEILSEEKKIEEKKKKQRPKMMTGVLIPWM